ncbi:hypothetical protein N7449_008189 [Penicillium cf. viridicatum]|uniref:Uncharacterized protein n=1 Tax=Penicillium cf. viridicatum TaxID=2972119 RepID=A0A9W9J8T0_9EURO|nr:hypothetical protein N7449_008189 [Penicillium cf. viridicatum]
MSDQDARLQTTTITSPPEYYDQVLALSSNLINESWEQLWHDNPQLEDINIDDGANGTLTGKLNPCQFFVTGNIENGVHALYKVRFKSGTLTTSGKHGQVVDVTGWEIAIEVELDNQTDDDMTDDQMNSITKYYNVPAKGHAGSAGDYSITRIFVDLIDANMNMVNEKESTFRDPRTGQPCTWRELPNDIKRAVKGFLDDWTLDQDAKGYNTLGVTLTSPTYEEEPVSVFHQGAKYANPNAPDADKYNCLLLCELLAGHDDLKWKYINQEKASWCYPGIDATYAISSHVILERFLGPHLQPLIRASEIVPTETEVWTWSYNHAASKDPLTGGEARWRFSIGHNSTHTDAADEYFKLNPVPNTTNYTWSKTNKGDTGVKWLEIAPNNQDPGYASLIQTGTTDINVNPAVGSHTVSVSGSITYGYEYRYSEGSSNLASMDVIASYGTPIILSMASYSGKWILSLSLSTDQSGQLCFSLVGSPSDLELNVKLDRQVGNMWNAASWDTDINTILKTQLHDSLTAAEQNLANVFQTTGKFVYPCNGELSFKNPMFNSYGDLLAEVAYKAAPKVDVPSPQDGPKLTAYPVSVDKSLGSDQGQKEP